MRKQAKIKSLVGVMVPFLTFIMLGCGGNKIVRQNEAMAEAYKQVINEKKNTNQRPEWTNQLSYSEASQPAVGGPVS